MQPGSQGSAVSSPNGVWGEAPAEIEFFTFYPQKLTFSGNHCNDFPDNQLAKFRTVLNNKGISWFLWQIDMDVYFAA